MSYVLSEFDKLITSLSPRALEDQQLDADFLDILRVAKVQKEEIKVRFLSKIFKTKREELLTLTIRNYQADLIRLIDQVYLYQSHFNSTSPYIMLYEHVGNHLTELLQFIEQHFNHYMDLDLKISSRYLNISQAEIKDLMPDIVLILDRNAQDSKLNDIIILLLEEFIALPFNSSITYRKLLYLKRLAQKITNLGSLSKEHCMYSAVKELMIYLNFNSVQMINHWLAKFQEEGERFENDTERIKYYRKNLKELRQMSVEPEAALYYKTQALHDQLTRWLEEEIAYISTGSLLPANILLSKSKKMKLEAPVPLISAVTRMFHELHIARQRRIARPGEVKELLEFVQQHFSSTQRELISYNALQSAFYHIEAKTADKAYDILMEMAKICKRFK